MGRSDGRRGFILRAGLIAPTVVAPPAMPLISRGRPAFDSGGFGGAYAAANAVDADYATSWRAVNVPSSGSPQWLALDLSGVPDADKASALLHWFNDASLGYYNTAAQGSAEYNNLIRDYTIDASAAAGGGSPPAVGSGTWVNLATATGNTYRSRQHALNLAGYTWVRLRITAANGPAGNNDITAQVNIHDAKAGNRDNILWLGDSILSECMSWRNPDGSAWTNGPLTKRIETAYPGRYPLYQNGGVPTTTLGWGNTNRAALLAGFTGKYVGLAWGANDASQPTAAATWYATLLDLIDHALGLNLTPIVPKVTKRTLDATADGYVQAYNARIDQLATDRPTVKIGPDFYAAVNAGTIALRDGLHPTYSGAGNGYEAMQGLWASWLAANIYG